MTRTAWFDTSLPRILAHRGLATGAPENGLEAFANALDAGATHLETDVRASQDGVAVLHHDPRLADGRLVAELSLDALRLAVPGLCTVPEALAALPGARFNLDVKASEAIEPLAVALRQSSARSRVLVTSFGPRRRRAALKRIPGVATSASADGVALALAGIRLGAHGLARAALAGVDAVQIPERLLGTDATTPWFIDALHRAGVEVHYWVVNNGARMRELVARGADGIVTDRPDVAADALR